MKEQVTIAAEEQYPLMGVLTLPESGEEKPPAVVLVHGSGPHDRDETIGGNKVFADLADGLARHGIATLRYDKRTFVYGKELIERLGGSLTVEEETIQDAICAVRLLKQDARIRPGRVFLAGHSLGAMLAPRIDAEGGDAAGLILMAGSPRPLEEIVIEQNETLLKELPEERRKTEEPKVQAIREVFAGLPHMTEEEAKSTTFLGQSSLWYWKEMQLHPVSALLEQIRKPILVLQGEKDVQVSVKRDFRRYQELLDGNPKASFRTYPGLNHLFMKSLYGTISEVGKEYETAQHIEEAVIGDIAHWIWSNS